MNDLNPHTVEAHRTAAHHLELLAAMLDEQAERAGLPSTLAAYHHAASMARTYAGALRAPSETPEAEPLCDCGKPGCRGPMPGEGIFTHRRGWTPA